MVGRRHAALLERGSVGIRIRYSGRSNSLVERVNDDLNESDVLATLNRSHSNNAAQVPRPR